MNESEITATQKTLLDEVLYLVKTPIIIALILTPIRYALELIGIPEQYIFILGLLWLTIGVSIYWGVKFYHKDRYFILLILSLIVFSPISRIPVAIAWWVDTNWEIGTHYGHFFNSFGEALFNQMVYGSLTQIIPGFLIGAITYYVMKKKAGAYAPK